MRSHLFQIILNCIFCLALALAQTASSIEGITTDITGAPVSGVTIVLVQADPRHIPPEFRVHPADEEVMRRLSNQGADLESHGLVDTDSDMTKHDAERLHQLIFRHMRYTNSAKAKLILDNWESYLPKFKKVMPVDYKRALTEMARQQAADTTGFNELEIGLRAPKVKKDKKAKSKAAE